MSAGEDQMVIVWDATTRQQLHAWKCDTRIVSSAAFSPNGDRIVTGIGGMKKSVSSPIQSNASFDKNIKVWDSTNGQELLTLAGHRYSVASVAFSPDGMRLVSGGYDPTIKVWDLASRREIFTLSGHTGRITSVAFSPDGKRITSGSDDRTIRLWDVASGQEVLSLRKHSGEVTCLAFSPDGHRIVSSSADGTVRIWEAGPGKRDPSQAAVQ